MSKHTQGPWTVENNSIYGNAGMIRPFIASVEDDHGDEETNANARLIAASPEMLAALMAAKSEMHYFTATRGSEAHELVRAAIAKATGEEI